MKYNCNTRTQHNHYSKVFLPGSAQLYTGFFFLAPPSYTLGSSSWLGPGFFLYTSYERGFPILLQRDSSDKIGRYYRKDASKFSSELQPSRALVSEKSRAVSGLRILQNYHEGFLFLAPPLVLYMYILNMGVAYRSQIRLFVFFACFLSIFGMQSDRQK